MITKEQLEKAYEVMAEAEKAYRKAREAFLELARQAHVETDEEEKR